MVISECEKKFRRNERVAVVNFGADKALLNVETGKYLYLNETGARIWDLLEKCPTVTEIASQMFSEYEIEVETVRLKIEKFIEKALAVKIIVLKID